MMNKFYMTAIAVLLCAAAHAQISVTFRVDMSNETVGPEGVFAAGDWQDGLPGEDGPAGDWNPTSHPMTDIGGGIYELTAEVAAGQYQFKYINSGNWEDVASTCQVGGGNGNRFFAVTDWHATGGLTLPAVQFMQCAPASQVAVRLTVDMLDAEGTALDIDPNGVHVAGSVVEPNWTPGYGTAYTQGGSTYQYVSTVAPDASYIYKWINGNDWVDSFGDESVSGECSDGGGNRVLEVGSEDVSTIAFCFGSCETCVDPTEVTFMVDMNGAGMIEPEGAIIAGTFTGWADESMTDMGDGLWSYTVLLAPGPAEWKFKNGPGGWEPNIGGDCGNGNNRVFEVPVSEEPVEVGPFCFATCDAECDVPDPANITFRVDMAAEDVAPEGVFLISSFFSWQGNPQEMMDNDGDGVYEVTLEYSGPAEVVYKYVNGTPDGAAPENEEFHGEEESPGTCVVPSGVGGWNRIHTRSGVDEVLPVVPFGDCGVLSTTTMELGEVKIFPNPTAGMAYVEVQNPNGHILRMSVLDVTGKVVRENTLLNSNRKEINTSNFAPGLYFLNIVNERSERVVYKLMVQ